MRVIVCLIFAVVLHGAENEGKAFTNGPNIGIVGKAPITYYLNNKKVATDKICFYENDTMSIEGAATSFGFMPQSYKVTEKGKDIYLVTVTFSDEKQNALVIELFINAKAEINGKQTFTKPGDKPTIYTFSGKITERLNQ